MSWSSRTPILPLSDPGGNGIELYYDRPREEWVDQQGNPVLKAEPVDLHDLLAESDSRSRVEANQSSKEY